MTVHLLSLLAVHLPWSSILRFIFGELAFPWGPEPRFHEPPPEMPFQHPFSPLGMLVIHLFPLPTFPASLIYRLQTLAYSTVDCTCGFCASQVQHVVSGLTIYSQARVSLRGFP